MSAKQELSSFIRSTFPSVWSLELLCFLRRQRERAWSRGELVTALRGSDVVVAQSLDKLIAAGLIVIEADGQVRYRPLSEELDKLTEATGELYAKRPDAVRRMIVAPHSDGLATFADAFKLRKD